MEEKNPIEQGKASESSKDSESNIKETIESILVAFILAFIFRAFVVEAFVIPTGSMATTLLGAHMRFRCPDCGYQFDVNVASAQPDNIPTIASPGSNIYCPNCGKLVASGPSNQSVQSVHYGDRILVLKYDYLLHPPRRWDVVVFKSPADRDRDHYQQNFIKRLTGLPGEQLMVLDGDVYIRNGDSAGDKDWQIQSKPPDVQEALWRVVYDNDYIPDKATREPQPDWRQPWQAGADSAGWNLAGANPRMFQFDNATGGGTIRFNPRANDHTQSFNDYLVYDLDADGRRSPDDRLPVSDLKLAADYHRLSGAGPLRLMFTRHEKIDHTFTAVITNDTVSLLHKEQGVEHEVGHAQLRDQGVSANSDVFVDLINVDYRCFIRLNGKEVNGLSTTAAEYHPDVPWLIERWRAMTRGQMPRGKMPEVSIEAENQTATLSHLGLWRDVYYTNTMGDTQPLYSATPDKPAKLNPGEYFMQGDNSAVSSDARYWTDAIKLPRESLDMAAGRVPEQFILGRAVFVYWPAGFRPFGPASYGIIPNFGDMRWIH